LPYKEGGSGSGLRRLERCYFFSSMAENPLRGQLEDTLKKSGQRIISSKAVLAAMNMASDRTNRQLKKLTTEKEH